MVLVRVFAQCSVHPGVKISMGTSELSGQFEKLLPAVAYDELQRAIQGEQLYIWSLHATEIDVKHPHA